MIVSTQSAELLNQFEAHNLIVVDRENDQSTFRRLGETELREWLDDYSLGEIWTRNVFGGRPCR